MNRIFGLCLVATALLIAPPVVVDADAQGWRPTARKRIKVKKQERVKPTKIRFDQNLVKREKRGRVAFKAFDLNEMGQKKGQRRGFKKRDKFKHKFSSGRRISLNAEDALKKINALEQSINAKGFSMRDKKSKWKGQGVTMPTRELNAQANRMKKKPGVSARTRNANFRTPQGNRLIRKGKSWKRAKFRSQKAMLKAKPEFTPPKAASTTGKKTITKKKIGADAIDKYDSGEMGESYDFGSKKTLKVVIHPTLQIEADKDVVQFQGKTTVDVNVFNSKTKNLLTGTATIKGDSAANKATAVIKLETLGKPYTIMNKEVKGKVKDDEWSKDGEWSYEFDFVVGPIPVSVEFGINYEFGIRYGFFAKPTRVGGYVTPYANSDAYAEAAVDLVIAEAGARGEVTLVDVEAAFSGEAGLAGDINGLYAYIEAGGDFGYDCLDGKVKVYVEHPFGEWEETLFKWGGIDGSINLFSLSKKVYLIGPNPGVKPVIMAPIKKG